MAEQLVVEGATGGVAAALVLAVKELGSKLIYRNGKGAATKDAVKNMLLEQKLGCVQEIHAKMNEFQGKVLEQNEKMAETFERGLNRVHDRLDELLKK